jgi:hypothetical protein
MQPVKASFVPQIYRQQGFSSDRSRNRKSGGYPRGATSILRRRRAVWYITLSSKREKMLRQILAIILISTASTSVSGPSVRAFAPAKQEPCRQDRDAWVAQALQKMETIKVGMTRKDLMKVFTTEGGLSTRLNRRFVSQDCPYFKVDVHFKSAGELERDADGRLTSVEDPRDIIVKISEPFLQFSIAD